MTGRVYWLDLETTGLDPHRDVILELCLRGGGPLEDPLRDEHYAHLVFPYRLEPNPALFTSHPMGPEVLAMHSASGLLAECAEVWERDLEIPLEANTTRGRAEAALLELVPDPGADREGLHVLAGRSVHFDLGFLRVHLPRLARRFSHRVLDVSAFELALRTMGMPKLRKGLAHRAPADVEESRRHYRACLTWLDLRAEYAHHPTHAKTAEWADERNWRVAHAEDQVDPWAARVVERAAGQDPTRPK